MRGSGLVILCMHKHRHPACHSAWWRHQMETFSALLAICAGNSPVPGEIPAQRPETRSFDVFFDLRLNQRLSKQSWGWWFETLPRPFWRHSNEPLLWIGMDVAMNRSFPPWSGLAIHEVVLNWQHIHVSINWENCPTFRKKITIIKA